MMRQVSHHTRSASGEKKKSRRPATHKMAKDSSSLVSRLLAASVTATTTVAAYSFLSTSTTTGVSADGGVSAFVEKADAIYSTPFYGVDTYPGIEADDGTGVATEEFRALSTQKVRESLELAGLNENALVKGADEAAHDIATIHPEHLHRIGFASSCPLYGCPFLPLDVHYEEELKSRLDKLRKRESGGSDGSGEYLLASSGSDKAATLTLIGYKGGPLEGQVNQDRAVAIVPYEYWKMNAAGTANSRPSIARLIGAFDGHAKYGERVSEYVARTLPSLLGSKLVKINAAEVERSQKQIDAEISQCLKESFLELDATSPADPSGGCTATVVLQLDNKIYITNAGDSRSMIAVHVAPTKGSEKSRTDIIFASREDKPHLDGERARVETMGGTVYLPNGFLQTGKGTTRVLYKDVVTGSTSGLAMSRSIGDWDAGAVGCIPDPIVDVFDIDVIKNHVLKSLKQSCDIAEAEIDPASGETKQNDCPNYTENDVKVFAVSATDGLLDYLPIDTIASHVAKGLYGKDEGEEKVHPLVGAARAGKAPLSCKYFSLTLSYVSHIFQIACEDLIYAAAQGWQNDKGGSYRDDIAISIADMEMVSESEA